MNSLRKWQTDHRRSPSFIRSFLFESFSKVTHKLTLPSSLARLPVVFFVLVEPRFFSRSYGSAPDGAGRVGAQVAGALPNGPSHSGIVVHGWISPAKRKRTANSTGLVSTVGYETHGVGSKRTELVVLSHECILRKGIRNAHQRPKKATQPRGRSILLTSENFGTIFNGILRIRPVVSSSSTRRDSSLFDLFEVENFDSKLAHAENLVSYHTYRFG